MSTATEFETEDATFERVLERFWLMKTFDMNTCLPGIVESYDPATETASVRPALKRGYSGGKVVDLPLLVKVPVMWPGSSSAVISFPLEPGDAVVLVFSQRSLDEWKRDGKSVKPADPRRHALADAYCFPGGQPPGKPTGHSKPDQLVIAYGDARIIMTKDGKVWFGNASVNLAEQLEKLAEEVGKIGLKLKTDTTNTGIGPQQLNGFTDYGDSGDAANDIAAEVGAIKGGG